MREEKTSLSKSAVPGGREEPREVSGGLPGKNIKICIVWGNPFETVNRATQCCGTVCGHRLAMPKAQATRSANAKVRRTRACLMCGVPFVMRNPSGKARAGLANEGRYCSRACASA